MKPYHEHESCPKCGSDDADKAWWSVRFSPLQLATATSKGREECLLIVCNRCAFSTYRACVDHGKAEE